MVATAEHIFSTKIFIGNAPTQLSRQVVWSIIAVCTFPFILVLLGVDFGSQGVALDPYAVQNMAKSTFVDGMFYHLTGAFHHALLEWAAFAVAIFTVVLAFSHYRITKDVTTPIIGVALFSAGCMDAFHTLAAARLIEAVAPNQDLIPFTWAICRIFNAAIMIVGVSLFLGKSNRYKEFGTKFILLTTMAMAMGIRAFCMPRNQP